MVNLYIIYPGGDKTKLEVIALESWEVNEYAVASRRTWDTADDEDAVLYAKDLAARNGLTCVTKAVWDCQEYLD